MAQKRPISDEVVYESTSKHQRQNGSSDEITLCNDSFSIGVSEKPYASGMGFVGEANLGKGDVTRSALLSHWASNISTSDEDEPPEDLFHSPSSPEYYSFDYSARPAIYSDDLHNCLLDYPPRKHVPIGPDHQAEIPRWGPLENKNVPDVGISILLSSETGEEVGYGRTVCNCPDKGSIRCVRQHVSEARDRLRRTFGQDTFAELGFNDMGEVVAEKWSAEEEELFDDIIYSNPASTGKDFWKALSAVFPSRTKMEIVSYYFNVNMLRKRAEQNRVDPLNIDSDNDEWQGSDNEESTVQDGLDDNSPQKQEYETDSDPAFDLHGKKSDEREKGIQDGGSSTSSDSGAQGGSCLSKSDGCLEWNRYNTLDSYDTKLLWENTSSSSPEIDLDFLPTCSMIEEIFGEGSFDSKGW